MAWQVSGTYMEACNCETACPCVFLSPPTEGECTVVIGWHIERGKFDSTVLDGLNVAMLVHSPGHMKDGNWQVALYQDDSANEEQQQALGGIFSGQAGGHLSNLGPLIGNVLGSRPAKIQFEHTEPQLHLEVEGVGEAKIAPIEGQEGGPIKLTGHQMAISPGQPAIVSRSETLHVSDHGLSCNMTGKNGFFAPYSYSG